MKRDFLLIDLRNGEEHEKYHIKESLNIPGMFFNQDRIPSDVFYYKNKPDRFIIVYHEKEEDGIEWAKLLTLKGY